MFEAFEEYGRAISFMLLITSFVLSSYYIPVVIDSTLEDYHRKLSWLNEDITIVQNRFIEFQSWEDKETALRIKYDIPLHIMNNTQVFLKRLTLSERDELLTVKRKALETLEPMNKEFASTLANMDFQELEEEKRDMLNTIKERLNTKNNEKELITENILMTDRKKTQFTLAMTFIQALGLFFTYITNK
ncbi:MAG: hypothetical protein ACLFVP_08275 [Candidatus Bathyarchaeia archaeon]